MTTHGAQRYPLAWPDGYKRTTARRGAAFKVNLDRAIRDLEYEIEKLGGKYPLLSTNIPQRLDGTLDLRRMPSDPGVAVYFERRGKQMVFACDTFTAVKDNIRAIGLTIESMRAIDRFGASSLLERALSAFDALPPPDAWWTVLGVDRGASVDEITAAYRRLAITHHPDRNGGSGEGMARINAARDQGIRERGRA